MAGMKRSADCLSSDSSGGSTIKKSKGRQVIKSTFDKWQREHEREHRTLTWLRCELDRDRVHVASLFCAACRKYERYVCSLKNFSSSWIEGSTNLFFYVDDGINIKMCTMLSFFYLHVCLCPTNKTICQFKIVLACHFVSPTLLSYNWPCNLREGAYAGTLFASSDSGWINNDLNQDWLKFFLKNIPPMKPVLLIQDGHASHMSIELIKLARANDVHLLCLPAHTTHIL